MKSSSLQKYKNKKTDLDGRSFQSQLEASVYCVLKLMQKAKELSDIRCQKHVYLTDARILYICDFVSTLADGSEIFDEAKGFETPEWRLKLKLWRFYGPGPLRIWKGTAVRPTIIETVIPILKYNRKDL